MSVTLAELTYLTAVELKSVREGVLTTAGMASVVDTQRAEGADYWNKGPFWVTYANSGSAPTWEYATVSDFDTGTMTFSSTVPFTASVPLGASYAVGRRRYPLDIIKQQLNLAYKMLDNVPMTDESLTTATETTEYDIPAAAQRDLRQVWIKTRTAVATDPGWIEHKQKIWRQEAGHLYLPQLGVGDTIKLVYVGTPSMLVDYDDTISDLVHPSRLIYKAAAGVILWRAGRLTGNQRSALMDEARRLLEEDQRASYDHPIVLPPRPAKGLMISLGRSEAEDEFTTPGPA